MKIAIGADHAGFKTKEELKIFLKKKKHEVIDIGCFSEKPVDYPDFANKTAQSVAKGECERGILICGTGLGMCIASNKIIGIRAVVCWTEEIAELSRRHNDANVLCLGSRILPMEKIKKITDIWIRIPFEKGRHELRVNKIKDLEK